MAALFWALYVCVAMFSCIGVVSLHISAYAQFAKSDPPREAMRLHRPVRVRQPLRLSSNNFDSFSCMSDLVASTKRSTEAGASTGSRRGQCQIALLTGGFDRPYVYGLTMALAGQGSIIEVVGSDDVDSPEMHSTPGVRFLNLRDSQPPDASLGRRIRRVLRYYAHLIHYAALTEAPSFHILWNSKIEFFDRTLLMLYYKALGKKIAFTVHNVNAGQRDGRDSWLNRLTLRFQYRLCDHLFVHTERMKQELLEGFGVPAGVVSVIPFGINNSVRETNLSPQQAKRRLGIQENEKTILFFGAIRPYKGLEYLIEAFSLLLNEKREYRLVIAGEPKREVENYLREIRRLISEQSVADRIIQAVRYIPDEETEIYFKAADVLALPYTHIFQSGVLFLAYSFGLPVVAADVGSFGEDVIEGVNGFLCRPRDAGSLAEALDRYFESELFKYLNTRRSDIRERAKARNSWDMVGEITRDVYARLRKGDRV